MVESIVDVLDGPVDGREAVQNPGDRIPRGERFTEVVYSELVGFEVGILAGQGDQGSAKVTKLPEGISGAVVQVGRVRHHGLLFGIDAVPPLWRLGFVRETFPAVCEPLLLQRLPFGVDLGECDHLPLLLVVPLAGVALRFLTDRTGDVGPGRLLGTLYPDDRAAHARARCSLVVSHLAIFAGDADTGVTDERVP
ncbi:hypothetical protein RBB84_18605 [Rhodococcus sp. D-6]|uniref:Uncharacterized protein n=1 Tax=Rhodococcus sp. D-6 TaxID=1387842 RepID=A0AAU7UU01_9NOCA